MTMKFSPAVALILIGLWGPLGVSSAQASEIGSIVGQALMAGDLAGGRERLMPYVAAGETEAQFGAGLIGFVGAFEALAQALSRHGLVAPQAGALGLDIAMPVVANPDPEPLDYAKVRAVLEDFVVRLDAARALLEAGGASGDYVLPLDPLAFRIDINGDGKVEATETIERLLEPLAGPESIELGIEGFGPRPDAPPTAFDEARPEGSDGAETLPEGEPDPLSETVIGFDRADSLWLAGYSQVLAAQADFLLAHDFSSFVNATFHRFFPRAGLPMQEYAQGGQLVLEPATDAAIADLIAGIHTLNWPVVEPDRLKRVLVRGKAVIGLSRRNWDAILAETDNARELLPGPHQSAIVPGAAVTDEMVAAWRETLDVAEQVLDGKLLVPHWRFTQGFDLKAYFETATRTDIVMMLTGQGMLPYLRDGPVATADSFAAANRVFGNNLFDYAFWFN